MRLWILVPLLALLGCPVTPQGGGPDTTEPTPGPTDAPGCEPLTLQEADVCDANEQPIGPWIDLEDPCPDFWDAAEIDDGGWQAPSGSWRVSLAGATPDGHAVSAYELREQLAYTEDQEPNVLDTAGALCGDATDVAACLETVAALEPVPELEGVRSTCQRECWWTYWVWTRGDEIGVMDSPGDLEDYLGPIDSVGDAELQVYARTELNWGSGELRDGAVREVADGYEFIGRQIVWGWPVRVDRYRMHIGRDGAVTEVDRAVDSVECGMILGR